jgi:hypothetical protein
MKPRFSRLLALSLAMLSVLVLPAPAYRLSDGKVHFVGSPQLLKVITTDKQAYSWFATYVFTISVPENAGEPLGRVVITPRPTFDPVDFNLDDTQAFVGTNDRSGSRLALQTVAVNPESRAINLIFESPVAPGTTIVIELSPQRNPMDGIYLYGVTAFPAGEPSQGRFLGYGRIQIYNNHF